MDMPGSEDGEQLVEGFLSVIQVWNISVKHLFIRI
jgi:hypothetical protein